jgi:hypothetical protein
MRRAGYLTSIEVRDLSDGEFELVGKWNGGEFVQAFTRQYVMGPLMLRTTAQQRPQRRVCWFRDEFVRRALAARGV